MRFLPHCLLVLLLLGSCAPLKNHGLVDARTLRQLDADAITRAEFQERLRSPALLSSLVPSQTRVTLPFRMVSGTPCIQAGIGEGRMIEMMIDTGAARMMMHARTAAKQRFTVVRGDQAQVTMMGVAGNEQGRLGIVSPLQLGDWVMQGYPCYIRTHENRVRDVKFPQNILGFDLAARVCSYLTLDYRKSTVTFGSRETYVPRAGMKSSSAPFRISQGVPFIQAKAGDDSWQCLVDTGSFNGIEIDEALAKKLGVQDQGTPVKGLYLAAVGGTLSAETAKLRTVTLPEVSLLGGKYPNAEVDIAPGPPRLGSFFLKDYCVTFDFRRKRLWLEW